VDDEAKVKVLVAGNPAAAVSAIIERSGRKHHVIEDTDCSSQAPMLPARKDKTFPFSNYKPGQRLSSHDGSTVYLCGETGQFRRITPKPLSKKAQRKAKRMAQRSGISGRQKT